MITITNLRVNCPHCDAEHLFDYVDATSCVENTCVSWHAADSDIQTSCDECGKEIYIRPHLDVRVSKKPIV